MRFIIPSLPVNGIADRMTARVGFGIADALRLKGQLDRDALQKALDAIVQRHEVLRTTFVSVGGELFQEIAPSRNFELRFTVSRITLVLPAHWGVIGFVVTVEGRACAAGPAMSRPKI